MSEEEFEELPEPSIFSTWWFRSLLVLVILAVVAVIAVPYVLEWWMPTAPPRSASVKPQIPPPPPPLLTQAAQKTETPAPSTPPPKPEAARPSLPPPAQTETSAAPPSPARVAVRTPAKAEAKLPPAPKERAPATSGTPVTKSAADGAYWIQLGAFKDRSNAAQLVAKLTEENYPAQESSLERAAGGTHKVFVTGASAEDVGGKLPAKRYRAEKAGAEVVIQPALPMAEAVTLSRQLARHGFAVKIRRASATQTFHVVRVGAYADRQRADSVRKELEGKGMTGFVVRDEKR